MQRELPGLTVVRQLRLPGMRRIRANANEIEFRYEQIRTQFTLNSYTENVETIGHGRVRELPSWLTDIITLGLVGNHAWGRTADDEFILWFTTDTEYHLQSFISPLE